MKTKFTSVSSSTWEEKRDLEPTHFDRQRLWGTTARNPWLFVRCGNRLFDFNVVRSTSKSDPQFLHIVSSIRERKANKALVASHAVVFRGLVLPRPLVKTTAWEARADAARFVYTSLDLETSAMQMILD